MGFGIDKTGRKPRAGGFGMRKSGRTASDTQSKSHDFLDLDSLPDYLEASYDEDTELFTLFYTEDEPEKALEVDVGRDSSPVNQYGSFNDADYALFAEHAETAMEEFEGLEHSYTLLEE